jgi:hypothetical protein
VQVDRLVKGFPNKRRRLAAHVGSFRYLSVLKQAGVAHEGIASTVIGYFKTTDNNRKKCH